MNLGYLVTRRQVSHVQNFTICYLLYLPPLWSSSLLPYSVPDSIMFNIMEEDAEDKQMVKLCKCGSCRSSLLEH